MDGVGGDGDGLLLHLNTVDLVVVIEGDLLGGGLVGSLNLQPVLMLRCPVVAYNSRQVREVKDLNRRTVRPLPANEPRALGGVSLSISLRCSEFYRCVRSQVALCKGGPGIAVFLVFAEIDMDSVDNLFLLPLGKIGGIASQAARLTRDLSSAFCRGVPPVKRIARAVEAEGVTFHQVAHRRSAGVGGLPEELGFDGFAVSRALVAVIVYLNGIPDRVRGRGTGHALRARLIPDLHRVGQAGSLTGIRVRGHGVSSREGRGLVTFNGNTAGIAAGIDDAVLVGHFGISSTKPIIGQQVRKIIGLLGIGVVGDLNRPGHPVTLVEDGVARLICQLHRLPVTHHAGQRLGYGDGFGGLGVLNNNSKVDSLLIPVIVIGDPLTHSAEVTESKCPWIIIIVING